MYGCTYNIYFGIYYYLYKIPKPKKVLKKIPSKQKYQIKKYKYNQKFEITLSPIYE
jgi:hypothetical protein